MPKDDGLGEFKPRVGQWAGVGVRYMRDHGDEGARIPLSLPPVPSGLSLRPGSFLGRVCPERPCLSEDKGGGEQTCSAAVTRGSGEWPVEWAPVWAAGFQALGASARPPVGLSDPGGSGFCSFHHLPGAPPLPSPSVMPGLLFPSFSSASLPFHRRRQT